MKPKKDQRLTRNTRDLSASSSDPVLGRSALGQRSTIEEHALTGGYYWFPTPAMASVSWTVLTCHELGCDAEVGHVDFWPFVIDRLAKAWRRDGRALTDYLKNHYTGLPRGRITQPKNVFTIFHGKDSPVPDWVPMVVRKFDLNRRSVKVIFDDHEQMLAENRMRVNEALGLKTDNGGIDKD